MIAEPLPWQQGHRRTSGKLRKILFHCPENFKNFHEKIILQTTTLFQDLFSYVIQRVNPVDG